MRFSRVVRFLLLATAICLVGAGDQDWLSVARQADVLLEEGKFVEARNFALHGERLTHSFSESDPRRRASLDQLKTISYGLNDVPVIEKYLTLLYEYDRKFSRESTPALLELASWYAHNGNLSDAEALLVGVLQEEKIDPRENGTSRMMAGRRLADLYASAARFESARNAYLDLLRMDGISLDSTDSASILLALSDVSLSLVEKESDASERERLQGDVREYLERRDRLLGEHSAIQPFDRVESLYIRARLARTTGDLDAARALEAQGSSLREKWLEAESVQSTDVITFDPAN